MKKRKSEITENKEKEEESLEEKKEEYILNTRISQEKDLIFLLFNQNMRHASVNETSMRFKSPKYAKKFMNLIQRKGFDKEYSRDTR